MFILCIKQLTNTDHISTLQVKLVSLYRYQPCIHIVQLDQPGQPKVSRSPATSSPVVASQSFKETQFIAVTAYQNDKVGTKNKSAQHLECIVGFIPTKMCFSVG